MPLALRFLGPHAGRVPILGERLALGRAPEADVVLRDRRLLPIHARLGRRQGEWVLAAESGATLWVNGVRVPLFALRHGDVVDLVDPASTAPVSFRLEDRLAGTFVPPGTSRWAAWLALPASADPALGPGAYTPLGPPAAEGRVSRARAGLGGGPVALRVAALPQEAGQAERALAPLVAVAAAPHPGLAALLDLGVASTATGPRVWSATEWIEGVSAETLLQAGPLGWPELVRLLIGPARGLAWLHRRGLIHRAVAPDHLLRTPAGQGVLSGWRAPALYRLGLTPSGALGPYLAPEEGGGGFAPTPALDVFALTAVALALLTGRPPAPPAQPGALRTSLRGALPEPLEHLLYEGLAALPAHRPNAADVARRLEALDAAVGRDES